MQNEKVKPTLVFVYNADSGLFNTVSDIAHKIFSPSTYACQLCALTHSYFSVKEDWSQFLKDIDYPMEFLHKDEFLQQYPLQKEALPALFITAVSGLELVLSVDELKQLENLDALKIRISEIVTNLE